MRLRCDPADGLCCENQGLLQKVFNLHNLTFMRPQLSTVFSQIQACGLLLCQKRHCINSKETYSNCMKSNHLTRSCMTGIISPCICFFFFFFKYHFPFVLPELISQSFFNLLQFGRTFIRASWPQFLVLSLFPLHLHIWY